MNLFKFATMLIAALVAGCGAEQGPPDSGQGEPVNEVAAEVDPVYGIDWYEGSVEDAFAEAAATDKPIYLYWGAAWCPPCHAISATVFKSAEFIERSTLFIPVYLDGDTENAQAYGEKFGVRGYPTMIVFDPSGEELTRIPGGIDLQAYANILDLTLNDASAVSDLVADLMAAPEPLSGTNCTLLAYYSWSQDTQILADHDRIDAFRRMYSACSSSQVTERSILYFSWLDAALTAAEDEEAPAPLGEDDKREALRQVRSVLADYELIKANIFAVLFNGAKYTAALTEPATEERMQLESAYKNTLDRIAADESIYKRERIYTLVGHIRFERMDDEEAELSEELKQRIRDTVAWADSSTPSVYERQPIINALGNILDAAGMDDVAKPLLVAELDKSKQPYYFMVSLADIEQRAGNFDSAIAWLKKAHEAATGPATRFQWGYYYVAGLIEMVPAETQLIHDTTVALVEELQNSTGLYQRPKAQLDRLEDRLIDWGEENEQQAGVASIRESVLQVCAGASQQGEARQTCESFLESV